jgi:hypothetical protein
VCLDKYKASAWLVPDTQTGLINKIQKGTVKLSDLTSVAAIAAGVVQRGVASDDYGPDCPTTGNGCVDLYAVSIAGVTPSRFANWFQAAAMARNSHKRLPTNQEWQAGALGTPDGAPCVLNAAGPGPTGTAGCVSDVGAFDMVGILLEWVADWVPLSTACVPSLFASDFNCLAGASTTGGPGALIRGGSWASSTAGGVFAVSGVSTPLFKDLPNGALGFRGVR